MAHGVYMTEHQHPSKLINDSVIYKLSTKQLGDFRILYFLGCTESEGLESAGLILELILMLTNTNAFKGAVLLQ